MRLLELKQEISRLSPSERRELSASLVRLRNESQEGKEVINQRMTEMDQGRKVPLSDLEKRLRARHGEDL
jgi:hypothetical protein